ncbi:MAG: beta-lactamase family protein [Geobacteraceae bacterium]|nr:beta-lactamase family protein [Geobacteraceae bacterium]
MHNLLLFLLLLLPSIAFSAPDTVQTLTVKPEQPLSPAKRIDQLMVNSTNKGLVSGGVILVGNRDRILFEKAYGRVSPLPDARPMTVDTLFDLASLTKVIATTPSILKLAEEGKLSLVDPVKKLLPEFEGKGKDELRVMNLLTHTSGFDDFSLVTEKALQSAVEGAAFQSLKGEIGNRFHYADINFILLGEIVRRVSGQPLNEFAAKKFYSPLGMADTGFLPSAAQKSRIASTMGDGGVQFTGDPQDYLSRQLGGVAGHAGLFSSAGDLAAFCRMMLFGGALGPVRVFEERTVNQMTAPYFSRGGKVSRGLGWDISSPYSSPRGGFFSRSSFGHTGYSGTSIWIDPDADLFVILLTTRLDFRKKSEFNQLRSELSTLAVEAFGKPVSLKELEDEL